MPREMPKPQGDKPQDVFNLTYGLATVMIGCIAPFLRSGYGVRAFRLYPCSALLMFVYAGAANCPLLIYYIPAWGVMVGLRRATCDARQHSRYQGWPWVFGWLFGEYVGRFAEAPICFFLAVFASMVSPPLADFLMAEIIAILIVLFIERAAHQSRRIDMHDARIHAQYMGEMHRGR